MQKKYYKIKTKKIKSLDKYYNSINWLIFSTEKTLYLHDEVYNTHHQLDYLNFEQQFKTTKINNKKIILIGKYHQILPVYRYLNDLNLKVYNIYI